MKVSWRNVLHQTVLKAFIRVLLYDLTKALNILWSEASDSLNCTTCWVSHFCRYLMIYKFKSSYNVFWLFIPNRPHPFDVIIAGTGHIHYFWLTLLHYFSMLKIICLVERFLLEWIALMLFFPPIFFSYLMFAFCLNYPKKFHLCTFADLMVALHSKCYCFQH